MNTGHDANAEEPARVALITHSFHPNLGGVETVTHALAQGLTTRHGHGVTVVTLDRSDSVTDTSGSFHVLRAPGILEVVRTFARADVVVFHSPVLKFAPLSTLMGVPRINVVHGRMADLTNELSEGRSAASTVARLRAAVKVTMRKAFIRTASLPVAVSHDVADECSIERVIHNGYDMDVFRIIHPPEQRDAGAVAFVGRLSPEKGAADAVDAVALLTADGTDVTLHVVGDGREQGALQARCEQLGILDRVCFHGQCTPSEVNAVLNQCTALVVPSRAKEAFAMVGIEAQGAGCVVVATDVGGLPESLGGSGLLVGPQSPDELARALTRVMRDDDLRERLRCAGAANAARHTVARMVDEHHDAIMSVARRSGPSMRARLLERLLSR